MANGLAFYDKKFMTIKQNKDLVAESITRILMTNPGERVGQPYFGVGLRNMLFNQIDDAFISQLKNTIQDQIVQYEPRADVTETIVDENSDENTISVKLVFLMKGDPVESSNILTYQFDLS